MKIWAIIKKKNKIISDSIYENNSVDRQTIFDLINTACEDFDIGKPIVLSKNENELDDFSRTVFYPSDFIESVNFDTFEIEIIHEK